MKTVRAVLIPVLAFAAGCSDRPGPSLLPTDQGSVLRSMVSADYVSVGAKREQVIAV